MSRWSRLSRGETTIDFVGLRRRWFAISAVLLLISLLGLGLRGLNLGLEFEGGFLIQAENPANATLADVRSAVASVDMADARIQMVDEGRAVRVQTGPLDQERQEELITVVDEITGSSREDVSIEAVGPSFGALVARQALVALLVFLGAAALFITLRLQWKMAGAGLAALFHDMLLTIGVYAIVGFEVTPATVVALLTILGYSMYDTVVVFDKVEEFELSLAEHHTYTQIVNRGMNQVLVRSIATSLTSLLPVGSLLFVGAIILGATSLQDFALALFVGIATGTYSSIFIAGPLLAMWKEREPFWAEHREKLERRAPEKVARPVAAEVAEEPAPRPDQTGATPRPPKRRKR